MKVKKMILEYFKEPFVWLGLSFLTIDILSGFSSPVNDFRALLFVNYFFLCFFFPTLYLSSMLITEPLKSIKEYGKRKKRKLGVFLVVQIFATLLLNALPPLFEPHMFYSDEFNAIPILNVVIELKAYVIIVGLIGSPTSVVVTKWLTRKQLLKDKIKIHDETNYGMIFSSSWMIFIILMSIFAFFDIRHLCFAKGFCP